MTHSPLDLAESRQAFFTPDATPMVQKIEVGKGGRVVIPALMRAALGVQEGDQLLFEMRGGELRVVSFKANLRRLQRQVAALKPGGGSVVEELLADRRREATREWDVAALGPLPPGLQELK